MYHRFSTSSKTGISLTAFRWHLDFLHTNFNLATLSEHIQNQEKTPSQHSRPTAVVTIDDGYEDFFELAYPELLERHLPATFFVTTDFVNQRMWFWFDQLRYIINNAKTSSLSIYFQGRRFSLELDTADAIESAWHTLADYCLQLTENVKELFVASIAEKYNVDISTIPENYSPVNWGQLKLMLKNRIEIGSHTLTHPVLSRLDAKSVYEELSQAKSELDQKLNTNTESLAYPFGMPDDYSLSVEKSARETGYSCAVVAHGELKAHCNPYQLTRISVSDDQTDFLWKVCGYGYLLGKLKAVFSHA